MADYDLDADFLFGTCEFYTLSKASLDLTLEVQEAAMQATYPAR